jgi:hypothetical protein
MTFTPWPRPIASWSWVVTKVFMIAARSVPAAGIQPSSLYLVSRYSASSEPIWLPVSSSSRPARLRTAHPMRSASGSVATTTSAPSRSASATARDSASAFSGLGDFTVGKRASPASCSGTGMHLATGALQERHGLHRAGAVDVGEDRP